MMTMMKVQIIVRRVLMSHDLCSLWTVSAPLESSRRRAPIEDDELMNDDLGKDIVGTICF